MSELITFPQNPVTLSYQYFPGFGGLLHPRNVNISSADRHAPFTHTCSGCGWLVGHSFSAFMICSTSRLLSRLFSSFDDFPIEGCLESCGGCPMQPIHLRPSGIDPIAFIMQFLQNLALQTMHTSFSCMRRPFPQKEHPFLFLEKACKNKFLRSSGPPSCTCSLCFGFGKV